jgi:hypothetical protein
MPDNTPSYLGQLGMGAATTAADGLVGGILGQVFAGANDRRQIRQQTKLQELQIKGQKEMLDYSKSKDLEMWKNTSYPAQLQMMEQAGLNPALMYGQGGGGGVTTGGSGPSVSGGSAQQNPGEMLGMANLAAQNNLIKAQTENIEADTANKQVQAPNTEANTENTKIDTANKGVQNRLMMIDERFKEDTYEANKAKNHYETNIAMHQAAITYEEEFRAMNTSGEYVAQMGVNLDKSRQELANLYLQGIKTKADTNLTNEQIEQVKQNIKTQIKQLQQGDRALDQKDTDLLIDQVRNDIIEKGIWIGAASNIAGDLIKIWTGGKKR